MTTKIRLTKRSVEALETPEKGRVTYQDTEDRYLHLVLTRSARAWRYIRKVKGRTAYITLGRYPDITPDQARQISRKTSAGYVEGRDPQIEKRQARIVTTWDDLFAWFIENHAKPHKKSWRTDHRVEKRYHR